MMKSETTLTTNRFVRQLIPFRCIGHLTLMSIATSNLCELSGCYQHTLIIKDALVIWPHIRQHVHDYIDL